MKRTLREYIILLLKGIAMGAADVVPGVSGGTIAFISGIYEELINSIKSINFATIKLFLTFKWAAFWKAINGNFLIVLVSGIMISIMSLAKLITYLLEFHPILVWSFFFGLVIASTYFVSLRINKWKFSTVLCFIFGVLFAYFVTEATPTATPNNLWFIFLCGSIAICAMILPGISGSFILVLLGKYFYVMEALKNIDLPIIFVFAAGAAIGIILFSNLLSYLLNNFYNITIAILGGFMLGSLNKVWPWKERISELITDAATGTTHTIINESNILPNELVLPAITLMIVGFLVVYILEKISGKLDPK